MDIARRLVPACHPAGRRRLTSLSVVTRSPDAAQMPTSDELTNLLRAVASAADRPAFAVLFKHFAPRIKGHLMRSGTPAELAEELAQETLACVWRKAASFDPARAQVSTWVFTIARNLRVDNHRRQGGGAGPSDVDIEDLADAEAAGDAPDESLSTAQREQGVRRALALLPDEQAAVLRRSFYEGQPHARIADELGIPLGTVKSRIRLAVGQLRRLLDEFRP
jgi:RNA polymerase sigma-70 factor (ECF subfamily)